MLKRQDHFSLDRTFLLHPFSTVTLSLLVERSGKVSAHIKLFAYSLVIYKCLVTVKSLYVQVIITFSQLLMMAADTPTLDLLFSFLILVYKLALSVITNNAPL